MGLGDVDFGLCSGKVRLILLGKAIAISERKRLDLGRCKTADNQQD
jgi:hypothetical protein